MYLMKAEEIVMKIDFDKNEYVVFDEKLLPFSLRGAIKKIEPNMSVNEIVKINTDNYGKVIEFLSKRTISLDRRNAKKLLNAYKLSQSQDPITKAKIAITCKAVSMTDSYWINDDQLSFTWDKMNLRTNQLNKVISHIMLFGKSITATGLPHTPELTGKGTYAQAWVRKGNETYLFKRSTDGGRESELEVSISRILDCFNVEHVVYNLTKIKDKENEYLASKCKNIASEDLAMVSAEEVYSFCARNNIDFEHYILSIDSESIYKMNVIDYLISNSDRHLLNWGFYMDNSTGQLIKCHPLFDHNNAFDKEQMEDKDGGQNLVFSHLSKKEAAMIGMKKCSLKCIKPVTRNMFLTKEMYESFMARACELGLYQENKKNWKHHLGLEHFEKYIPASDVLSLSDRLSNNQSMIDKHKQNVTEITYHKMDRE